MILSSLRNRIFLTSALLAVLSIGAAIYLVSVRVTSELEESLQREIRSTGELVEQLRTTRAQTFTMMARLIADAPTLKAAVDTNDPATVQNNATDLSEPAEFESAARHQQGGRRAGHGRRVAARRRSWSRPSRRSARRIDGGESLSLIPQPDGILHLVTVPIVIGISHPDILGTLSVGFLLDDAFARQLKQVTGSEIAFGMDGQILASTLPREARPALSRASRRREHACERHVPRRGIRRAAAAAGAGQRAPASQGALSPSSSGPAPSSSAFCTRFTPNWA